MAGTLMDKQSIEIPVLVDDVKDLPVDGRYAASPQDYFKNRSGVQWGSKATASDDLPPEAGRALGAASAWISLVRLLLSRA
jgi:hypothetical protein